MFFSLLRRGVADLGEYAEGSDIVKIAAVKAADVECLQAVLCSDSSRLGRDLGNTETGSKIVGRAGRDVAEGGRTLLCIRPVTTSLSVPSPPAPDDTVKFPGSCLRNAGRILGTFGYVQGYIKPCLLKGEDAVNELAAHRTAPGMGINNPEHFFMCIRLLS